MLYQPFDKYEYKTGADLGYKPEVVEQAKFGYSSLGQTLTNILKKELKLRHTKNTIMKYHQ